MRASIEDHVIWEPEPDEEGWMHCTAPGCDKCWHRGHAKVFIGGTSARRHIS
jgi:hypothetical protein